MSTPPPGAEPTQEEIEAYLAELRAAPVAELLLQAFSVLGTGAEVKLGLPDARVLIDAMDAMVRATGGALGDTGQRLAEAVAQLKVAQVQTEAQMRGEAGGAQMRGEAGGAQDGAQGGAGQGGDAPSAAGAQPGQPGQAAQPGPLGQPEKKATDKLWIPGRDG